MSVMGSRERRLARMAANPRDWSIDDVQALCAGYGLAFRRRSGSHATVSHPTQPEILTIPANRPIKPVYIRQLIRFIEKVEEEAGQ